MNMCIFQFHVTSIQNEELQIGCEERKVDAWMNEYMDEWMYGWMVTRTDRWMHGWMDGGRMHRWLYRWMDECMDRGMHGWKAKKSLP